MSFSGSRENDNNVSKTLTEENESLRQRLEQLDNEGQMNQSSSLSDKYALQQLEEENSRLKLGYIDAVNKLNATRNNRVSGNGSARNSGQNSTQDSTASLNNTNSGLMNKSVSLDHNQHSDNNIAGFQIQNSSKNRSPTQTELTSLNISKTPYKNPDNKRSRTSATNSPVRKSYQDSPKGFLNRSKDNIVYVPDSKVALYEQLIFENGELRKQLDLELVDYKPIESLNPGNIDQIIGDLLDHNEAYRQDVLMKQAAQEPVQYGVHHMYQNLHGNSQGCAFWVPLKQSEIEEQLEREYAPLPNKSLKEKERPYDKCEKALLLASRFPPFPPNNTVVDPESAEFQQVASWLSNLFKKRAKVTSCYKTLMFWRFIEMERNFRDIRLYISLCNNPNEVLKNGFTKPATIADHPGYLIDALNKKASVTFIICAADTGNRADNACEHVDLPSSGEMNELNEEFDSLEYNNNGHRAICVFKLERILPIYSVCILSTP